MGLCKCQRRKVTNLFCFEHDVNVCEYCLVSDHEGCIVQSYVQWLQDSDYNPICILCQKLLKEEPTVRLICYDVFHWSCLDKYASSLPSNTAPAGYQCPKCRECVFPPSNLVSPLADALRNKLEGASWARVGLSESLIPVDSDSNLIKLTESVTSEMSVSNQANSNEEESNGFVIVKSKSQGSSESQQLAKENTYTMVNNTANNKLVKKPSEPNKPISSSTTTNNDSNVSHNRSGGAYHQQGQQEFEYDPSLGIVLNVDNLDRDTGDYKYQRRPMFEWLARWMRSRQLNSSRFRMTRQKKTLFMIILIFMSICTLVIIFSRLGSMNTENDPALDPMNNPNIRVQ